MSILVTGGAGFIGSHTTERLLADGERIVVVDDFNDFYSPKKKQANIAGFVSHPKSVVVKADIRNSNAMNRLFSKHKINRVVHLAGLPGVRNSVENPRDYFDVNVNGTANLLELSRVHKVSQFVFASTSSVYGKAESFPTRETDSTEKQLSPYAASKKMGEVIGRSYFLSFNLPVTCLRFFTVYGPRNRPVVTTDFGVARQLNHPACLRVLQFSVGAFQTALNTALFHEFEFKAPLEKEFGLSAFTKRFSRAVESTVLPKKERKS